MTVWLVSLAHSFVAAALVAGLIQGLGTGLGTGSPPSADDRRLGSVGTTLVLIALGVGAALYLLSAARHGEVAARTGLRGVAVLAAGLGAVVAGWRCGRISDWPYLSRFGGLGLVALLSAQAMFDLLARAADHSLSATTVLNTELILNLFAIAAGLAALMAVVPVAAHAARGAPLAAALTLAVVLAGMAVIWSADLLLGLLQQGQLEVTSLRVSYVARLTEARPWATYFCLALAGALALHGFLAARRRDPGVPAAAVDRRLRLAVVQSERRWLRAALATAGFLVAVMLYHDLYASQPPRLSAAMPVTADADGQVRIPVAEVKDGRLHRFAWIASDGHRVRFFLINRYDPEHVSIGVVFDACMICGNQGYIQEGSEVICVACNVRLFTPSIGKPGGCNPIPLPHQASPETITITTADLSRGVKFFSEIVELQVTDPVTGARLLNLKAPYQYDYGGNTWFFESRDSYEKFRSEPERYAPARGA